MTLSEWPRNKIKHLRGTRNQNGLHWTKVAEIKRLRKTMSQSEIARSTNVHINTVGRILRGERYGN